MFGTVILFGLITLYVQCGNKTKKHTGKNSPKPPAYLFMQIVTDKRQLYINLMKLDQDIGYYTFSADQDRFSAYVRGVFSPKLIINWPSFDIINTAFQMREDWPKEIPVGYSEARTIRKAIRKGEKMRPLLYFCRSGDDCPSPIPMIRKITVDYDNAPDLPDSPEPPSDMITLERLYPIV